MADIYSDDDEDLCPLCIEEMDISDKNFKPCPCGYQICQFCYNSIRNEMNGRCPACRRIYDDESVEYRQVSPEEIKRDHARQARREKERRQREKTNIVPPDISKKHLAGMRVIQKNLVYVIGLNPNISTEDLHNTLRTEAFFGQYGKIQKIVINKRTNANGNLGLGVYVTFAKKEDAARCIQCVDGSLNDGKYLRAAYGTTKYCSSYLRGQTCPNPNCMFLHEPGEDADSYTRRDLSAMQHRNPPSVVPSGLPSLTQATAPLPQATVVTAAPLPTASAWARPALPKKSSPPPNLGPGSTDAPGSGSSNDMMPSGSIFAGTQQPTQPIHAPKPVVRDALSIALSALTEATPAAYSFNSPYVTDTSYIPHYFAFNLSPEVRLAQYQQHWDWLSGIEAVRVKKVHDSHPFEQPASPRISQPLPETPLTSALSSPQANSSLGGSAAPGAEVPSSIGSAATAGTTGPGNVQQTTPPPGLFGNINTNSNSRNSQELLAHLMKGKASSQKLNKQLNKYFDKESPFAAAVYSAVQESRSGPPVEAPSVEVVEPQELPVGPYIDDGAQFSAGHIPRLQLVGDSEPSVWAGVEKFTRLEKQSLEAQRGVAAANSTMKRVLRQMDNN